MLSCPVPHTHTCTFDTLNTCVSNMNGRFLTMHHTDLIGHLTVSISLMMKPNSVRGLRCRDRKVSVHKTIVLEKESIPKKALINMYKHYPTQHMAN